MGYYIVSSPYVNYVCIICLCRGFSPSSISITRKVFLWGLLCGRYVIVIYIYRVFRAGLTHAGSDLNLTQRSPLTATSTLSGKKRFLQNPNPQRLNYIHIIYWIPNNSFNDLVYSFSRHSSNLTQFHWPAYVQKVPRDMDSRYELVGSLGEKFQCTCTLK